MMFGRVYFLHQVLAETHAASVQVAHSLAIAWNSRGQSDDANVLTDKCLQLRLSDLGPNHPSTRTSDRALRR